MKRKSSRTVLPQIHAAVFHLLRCWDELNDAEAILEFEITVDDLGVLAGVIDLPEDAARVTTKEIDAWYLKT